MLFVSYPHAESNRNRQNRNLKFYPLNYRALSCLKASGDRAKLVISEQQFKNAEVFLFLSLISEKFL